MKRLEIESAELYSFELDWYVTQRDSACNARSTMGGQVSVLESGGAFGEPNTNPYNDAQAGLGPVREGAFALDRKMLRRWPWVPKEHQRVIVTYYLGRQSGSGDERSQVASEKEKQRLDELQTAVARRHGYTPDRKFGHQLSDLFNPFEWVVIADNADGPKALTLSVAKHEGKFGPDHQRSAERIRGKHERRVRAAHRAYYDVVARELVTWSEADATWLEKWERMQERVRSRSERIFEIASGADEGGYYPTRSKGDGVFR